jgi:hypothetical protein
MSFAIAAMAGFTDRSTEPPPTNGSIKRVIFVTGAALEILVSSEDFPPGHLRNGERLGVKKSSRPSFDTTFLITT